MALVSKDCLSCGVRFERRVSRARVSKTNFCSKPCGSRYTTYQRHGIDPETLKARFGYLPIFDVKKYHAEYAQRHKEEYKIYAAKSRAKESTKMYFQEYYKTEGYLNSARNSRFKRRYGITLDTYNMMLEEQKGLCFLCGELPKEADVLCVDHNKGTGQVRKLLCRTCNSGLGGLKHDPELLRKAARYIETFLGVI